MWNADPNNANGSIRFVMFVSQKIIKKEKNVKDNGLVSSREIPKKRKYKIVWKFILLKLFNLYMMEENK